jgi:hypothetical protein
MDEGQPETEPARFLREDVDGGGVHYVVLYGLH